MVRTTSERNRGRTWPSAWGHKGIQWLGEPRTLGLYPGLTF